MVKVVVSIASEKVTPIVVLTELEVAVLAGVDEETVGAVVSGVFEVVNPVDWV